MVKSLTNICSTLGYMLSFMVVLAASSATYASGDSKEAPEAHAARVTAASCAACHSTNGNSVSKMPSLAGRSKDILIKSMQDFKQGWTDSTVMHQLMQGYTDEQIESVAEYFSKQKAE